MRYTNIVHYPSEIVEVKTHSITSSLKLPVTTRVNPPYLKCIHTDSPFGPVGGQLPPSPMRDLPPPRVSLPLTSKKIMEYYSEISVPAILLKVFALKVYEIWLCSQEELAQELLLPPIFA